MRNPGFLGRLVLTGALAGGLVLGLTPMQAEAGTVAFSYDVLGRVTCAVYPNGAQTISVGFTYDATGNRTEQDTVSSCPHNNGIVPSGAVVRPAARGAGATAAVAAKITSPSAASAQTAAPAQASAR